MRQMFHNKTAKTRYGVRAAGQEEEKNRQSLNDLPFYLFGWLIQHLNKRNIFFAILRKAGHLVRHAVCYASRIADRAGYRSSSAELFRTALHSVLDDQTHFLLVLYLFLCVFVCAHWLSSIIISLIRTLWIYFDIAFSHKG